MMERDTASDPLAISFFWEIATVDQLARARITRALPKGMELSHFLVLNHLALTQMERTPAELARLFHVTKGAMTNTVHRLEDAGFIHVRPDWDDARRKLVSISPAGVRARTNAVDAISPVFEHLVQQIGAEKVRSLMPTLQRLRGLLSDD